MAKTKITQEEYIKGKHCADVIYSKEVRALKRWYEKYEEYYEGERDLLYRQYMTEIHNKYNNTLDKLQLMLIGVKI